MKPHLVVAALALAVVPLIAQDPPKMFRSGVQTVPIYATVIDSNGRLMPDLKEEDFEVLDNCKPAPITLFDATVQPIAVVIALDMSGSMINCDRSREGRGRGVPASLAAQGPREAHVVRRQDHQSSQQFSSNRDELIRFLRTEPAVRQRHAAVGRGRSQRRAN